MKKGKNTMRPAFNYDGLNNSGAIFFIVLTTLVLTLFLSTTDPAHGFLVPRTMKQQPKTAFPEKGPTMNPLL